MRKSTYYNVYYNCHFTKVVTSYYFRRDFLCSVPKTPTKVKLGNSIGRSQVLISVKLTKPTNGQRLESELSFCLLSKWLVYLEMDIYQTVIKFPDENFQETFYSTDCTYSCGILKCKQM